MKLMEMAKGILTKLNWREREVDIRVHKITRYQNGV